MLKDYLNKEERVQLLFLKKFIDNIDEMLSSTNLTKEEHKALKTARTWGLKGFNSKAKRLNNNAIKTFWNSVKNAYINVEDRYAVEMYNQKLSSKLDDCYEMNRDYYKLVELTFYYNCKNCNKCNNDCEIYKEFEERCIPEPTGEDLENCRYAYKE
ncbi:MAG: hypothetical protein E7211_14220 [Clostridium lundense]|nr:hypothetical protein [Clostridium lundense]